MSCQIMIGERANLHKSQKKACSKSIISTIEQWVSTNFSIASLEDLGLLLFDELAALIFASRSQTFHGCSI